MKHIKGYKIFENINIKDDISDICLELIDDDFEVEHEQAQLYKDVIMHFITIKKPYVVVFNRLQTHEFYLEDIKDTTLRLMSYLDDKYTSYRYENDHQYLHESGKDINKLSNLKITSFTINWEEQL
jgi:hypothetical protein